MFPLSLKRRTVVRNAALSLAYASDGMDRPASLYEKVKGFQDESALHYYMRTFGVDKKIAEEHFQEMLKFLCLARFDKQITPSEQVDQMWHAMIIQTKGYRNLCAQLGEFIDHTTTDRPQKTNYDNALKAYQAEFGNPHSVWLAPPIRPAAEPASDDDCEECRTVGWCGLNS